MSFKVVQTIERGLPYLSVVPMQWEIDGILYWPKRDLYSLRENPASVPDLKEWRAMSCTVKRRGIQSLIEAQKIEKEMSRVSDTEGDADDHQPRLPNKRKRTNANCSKADEEDFNSLFLNLQVIKNL